MLRQLQEMWSLSDVVSLRRGRCRWKQSMQYVVRPVEQLIYGFPYEIIRKFIYKINNLKHEIQLNTSKLKHTTLTQEMFVSTTGI